MDIEPYIMVNENGFGWYYYLHIKGGEGHGRKGLGGRFNFVLCYLSPEQDQEMTVSPECYCADLKIPFGSGSTIEEAYANFQEAYKLNPIK